MQPFEVTVAKPSATLAAYRMPGSSELLIIATGLPGHPPTGSIELPEQSGNPRVEVTLVPVDTFRSSAAVVRPNVDVAPTFVSYTGDSFYDTAFRLLPLSTPNRRSARCGISEIVPRRRDRT